MLLLLAAQTHAQTAIPIDTLHWEIEAQSYILESHKGEDAVYLKGGSMKLKDRKFSNGTIEYDIHLKEAQSFPGVNFRVDEAGNNGEEWYIRPHLSGKPDANQTTPLVNGIAPWQLYFGPKYSFPYNYNFDDWTHVKLVIDNDRAQVFLDYSKEPNLSWNLLGDRNDGDVYITGGNRSGFHIANIKVDHTKPIIVNFNPKERKPIEGIVSSWKISDKFEEKRLDELEKLTRLISERSWKHTATVEEGVAANISRQVVRYDDNREANTVFAKIVIHSDTKQTKYFDFGYSDRVVALLNGKPIYRGTNRWRSRDYRYLGTIGLFDGIYLHLKKGKNELLMAVSEDFGGWLITGKFPDKNGITIEN